MGVDGLWMVFKATRLDEITKEVRQRAPPPPPVGVEEKTARETEKEQQVREKNQESVES